MWPVKKKLGEFNGSQIVYEGRCFIPRIPIECDKAKESEYEVWKEGRYFITIINSRYVIICKKCSEKLELDIEEYMKIRRLLKLNNKLQKQKIDFDEHSIRLDKLKRRLGNM